MKPGFGQHPSRSSGFVATGVGQWAVVPTGEQVSFVPFGSAVANEKELVHSFTVPADSVPMWRPVVFPGRILLEEKLLQAHSTFMIAM